MPWGLGRRSVPGMAAAPEGTVTLLFTDIEGSTRLLARAGEGYADLLAVHHRLLREVFGAHGGFEAKDGADLPQSIVSELERLATLHHAGSLSDEEFTHAKSLLLAVPVPPQG